MRNGIRSDCTKKGSKTSHQQQSKKEEVRILQGTLENDGEKIPVKIEARVLGRTKKVVKVELSDKFGFHLLSNLLGRPIRRQCCLPELTWGMLLAAI